MKYQFLVLCGLLLIPGTIVFAVRTDLRRVILTMGLCSLPFALTESLFYPTYWEPRFLFDLVNAIGFGIEDFIFVFGLAAFTSTVYPVCFNRRFEAREEAPVRVIAYRIAALLCGTFALTGLWVIAGLEMIWGSVVIMLGMSTAIWWSRRDLIVPSLLGGGVSALVYGAICYVFALLIPHVFELSWHVERFSNVYLLGVPLEEILYSAGAGVVATAFYPFAFSKRFEKNRAEGTRIEDDASLPDQTA
jgi:hypothetical protein